MRQTISIDFFQMILASNNSSWCKLEFTKVEHVLEEDTNIAGVIYVGVTTLLILGINGSLIFHVLPVMKTNIINKFIIFDCIICIGNIFTISNIFVKYKSEVLCGVAVVFNYTWNILNACLSFVIIFYRSIMVFKSSWMETKQQRRWMIGAILTSVTTVTGFLCYQIWQNVDKNFTFYSKFSI